MTTTLTLPRDVAQQLLQAMQPLLLLAQKSHMGLSLLPAAPPGTLQASAVNHGLALARAVREFELAVEAAREIEDAGLISPPLRERSERAAASSLGSGPAAPTPA